MQGNFVYTVYQIYKQNFFFKKSVLAISIGTDSLVLLIMFNLLDTIINTQIQLVSCNHFTQKINFYTIKEIYKISYLFNNKLIISCPIQTYTTENQNRIWRHQIFRRTLVLLKQNTLYLAHSQTDKVETTFFNLLRGTTLNSLISLDYSNSYNWIEIFYKENIFTPTLYVNKKKINYCRPILPCSRKELQRFNLEFQLPNCIDSTNFTTKYKRNQIRLILTPIIRYYFNNKIETQIDKFSIFSKYDLYYLDYITNKLITFIWAKNSMNMSLVQKEVVKLPQSLQFRLLRKLIQMYSGNNINSRVISKLILQINTLK